MSRSNSWTFPRWGAYKTERDPVSVRGCDYDGCDEPGDFPAPKSPDSPEKWYFCQPHVEQYNRGWNYFSGRNKAEAFKRAQDEMRTSAGYKSSAAYEAPESYGAESRRSDALNILDLEDDATAADIKAAYRRLVKLYHPDTNLDDANTAIKFQQVKTAYEVLKTK